MAVSESGAALNAAAAKYGLTNVRLGQMLGISERMVRKVRTGERPGLNLAAAARRLAGEGRVTEAPPRRAQSVRTGPKGAPTRRVGQDTPGRGVARGTAGAGGDASARYAVETGGRSKTTVDAPRRGLGREAARQAILGDLRAHRGGKRGKGGERVTFTLRLADGRTVTVGGRGGYDPKIAARRMAGEGDDPYGWLSDELDGEYAGQAFAGSSIVGVTMTYY